MDDEWGKDPKILAMRRVFSAIEAQQNCFLDRLDMHPRDGRLGPARRSALHLFERIWAGAAGRVMPLKEGDAVDLYVHCLARALQSRGVPVSPSALPPNETVERLLEESE